MMCVEFDLSQSEMNSCSTSTESGRASLKSIFKRADQEFTNSNFYIKLNGICHSHSIFEKNH